MGAQAEVNGLACSIDGPVEIGPLASDLQIVDAPIWTGFAGEAIPALLELGREPLDPSA